MNSTALITGIQKDFRNGLKHAEFLVTDNKTHSSKTMFFQPYKERMLAFLILLHSFGSTEDFTVALEFVKTLIFLGIYKFISFLSNKAFSVSLVLLRTKSFNSLWIISRFNCITLLDMVYSLPCESLCGNLILSNDYRPYLFSIELAKIIICHQNFKDVKILV